MSENRDERSGLASLWQGPTRLYVVVAAVLVVIIIVAAVLLLTGVFSDQDSDEQPTATVQEGTATTVPTFTPGPTRPPTDTPPPAATATMPPPIMADTDDPQFELQSAGGRPSTEWTGFFGQVLDADGEPLEDVPLILWYPDPDGIPVELLDAPDSPIVWTDADGTYEMRIAERPFTGTWTIQVLADDGLPASKLFTFETSDDPDAGFQQIQVIWQRTGG